MRFKIFISCGFIISFFNTALIKAQVVYQHTDNTTIYDFIDELATQKYIKYNSVVLPLSRKDIASFLDSNYIGLSIRQEREQSFYLKDFNKELKRDKNTFDKRKDAFYYTNDKFLLSVNPILGVSYQTIPKGFNRYVGAQADMYLGKNWAAYVNFREYYEAKQLTSTAFLNQLKGGEIRSSTFNNKSIDFSEIRGGITYDWGWGNIGFVQDHFTWGNGYHGNTIFSAKIPAIPQLKLKVKPTKWLEFNSIYAWLQSNLTDSARTYSTPNLGTRTILREKYLAANFFSVRPVKGLWVSLGNSTIIGDIGIHPSYLIPLFFYRPIDHLLSGKANNDAGQNGQLFFDISSRNIKNVHLYSTLFIDELLLSAVRDKDLTKRRNQISIKVGGKAYLTPNLSFLVEYTRANPFAYRHYIPVTTFTSSDYPLGWYMGDNSQEIYSALSFKPIRGLHATVYYLNTSKGETVPFIAGQAGSSGIPFQAKIDFKQKEVGLKLSYEAINDVHLFSNIIKSSTQDATKKYLPLEMEGNQLRIELGFQVGF